MDRSPTLYDKVKDALRRGLPPAQVAAAYGVSVHLAERVAELVQKKVENNCLLQRPPVRN